jgi:hypothetical protein
MNTLYATELDIAGGRWPRDQSDGMRRPFRQPRDSLGNQPYHLFGIHDTQMLVRDQRQCPSPLSCTAIQDNRPRLSNGKSATGKHCGAFV